LCYKSPHYVADRLRPLPAPRPARERAARASLAQVFEVRISPTRAPAKLVNDYDPQRRQNGVNDSILPRPRRQRTIAGIVRFSDRRAPAVDSKTFSNFDDRLDDLFCAG